jgi:hypothetical protein
MSKLRVWIDITQLENFTESQANSVTDAMNIWTYPSLKTDLCYELVPVSKEQLEREADEGIKQIDKEMK